MPRLAICSRDLLWQWINWAPLYDTMEVSMLRLMWLTVAQHVFQPALTGRLELISRKIVSCEPGTKAIAVSRFREKLGPRSYRDFAKNIALLGAKKWGPTCDRDISNSAIYATAIYRAYTAVRWDGFVRKVGLVSALFSEIDAFWLEGLESANPPTFFVFASLGCTFCSPID